MNIRTILTGEILSNKRLVRRIPVVVVIFLLIIAYIHAGYQIQSLKQRENNLNDTYKALNTSALMIHQKTVQELSIENINNLIKKYNLSHLNIKTESVLPIEVKND